MKKLLTIIASATATIFAFGAGAEFTESGTSFENYPTNILLTTKDDSGSNQGYQYWYSAANPDEAPFVITNAVVKNDTSATMITFQSNCAPSANPICEIALGANPKPIIIIIGPITIGGNNFSIHSFPTRLIIIATII